MKLELDELLSLKQAAKILNVSPQTLRRWDKQGLLKAVRVGKRRGIGDRRYRKKDIEDYIKNRKNHMNISELVVNESYWKLLNGKTLRKQSFLVPNTDELSSSEASISEFTRNLCLLLQNKDEVKSTIYGIEIKTNGSSRSGRIPLVRINDKNQSIWKVVNKLTDVDKSIKSLDKLIYYLKESRPTRSKNLPKKVLLANFDESEYLEDEKMSKYVKNQVVKNDIVWISSAFIVDFLKQSGLVDLNSIFIDTNSINIKETFE